MGMYIPCGNVFRSNSFLFSVERFAFIIFVAAISQYINLARKKQRQRQEKLPHKKREKLSYEGQVMVSSGKVIINIIMCTGLGHSGITLLRITGSKFK